MEAAQESGDGFRADLPLAILESMRSHDRPEEILEDEDLMVSLPRRLGLTGVVESQIQRYRLARRRGERISRDEVRDILRLVLRRPDADTILRAAGREIARIYSRRPLQRAVSLARFLPEFASTRVAKRGVRILLRRIAGGSTLRVVRRPFSAELEHPVTAGADALSVACVLYGAAIEEAFHSATGRRPHVEHVMCESRGGERCVWEVQ